jgi:hypothetical protein
MVKAFAGENCPGGDTPFQLLLPKFSTVNASSLGSRRKAPAPGPAANHAVRNEVIASK